MKAKNKPRRGPEEEIVLAFDAVDVREETGHKERGDQQRQGNKALKYQSPVNSPSGKRTVARSTKAQSSFAL